MKKESRDPTEIEKRLGMNLRALRQDAGITQKDFARLLISQLALMTESGKDLPKISQPTVTEYEQARLRLHGQLILAICEVLECAPNALLSPKREYPEDFEDSQTLKNPKLKRRIRKINQMTPEDQETLVRLIDSIGK